MASRQLFDPPPRLFDPPRQLFAKAAKPDASALPSIVWGWASVSSVDGVPVVDSDGDLVTDEELQKAAHEFMSNRTASALHMRNPDDGQPVQVGTVVESLVVTDALAQALGADFGGKRGWLIAMRIDDPNVRRALGAGRLPAFSIGGSGLRRPV